MFFEANIQTWAVIQLAPNVGPVYLAAAGNLGAIPLQASILRDLTTN